MNMDWKKNPVAGVERSTLFSEVTQSLTSSISFLMKSVKSPELILIGMQDADFMNIKLKHMYVNSVGLFTWRFLVQVLG